LWLPISRKVLQAKYHRDILKAWLNILTGLGPEMPVQKGGFPMNHREAAHNTQNPLINFVLLWCSDLNRYSVDGLPRRKR
jgi:hypothetical protein